MREGPTCWHTGNVRALSWAEAPGSPQGDRAAWAKPRPLRTAAPSQVEPSVLRRRISPEGSGVCRKKRAAGLQSPNVNAQSQKNQTRDVCATLLKISKQHIACQEQKPGGLLWVRRLPTRKVQESAASGTCSPTGAGPAQPALGSSPQHSAQDLLKPRRLSFSERGFRLRSRVTPTTQPASRPHDAAPLGAASPTASSSLISL